MQFTFTRLLVVLFMVWFAAPSSLRAAITLDRTSNITITTQGPATRELKLATDLLDRYLRLALSKELLTGTGTKIEFVIEARAVIWHQLPPSERNDARDLDAFTIEIQDAPQPRVRITAATVLGACFGVIDFLERDIGITWLFPGELGLSLPESSSITLAPSTRRVLPAVPTRFYTGMQYAQKENMPGFRRDFRASPLFDQRHFFEAHDYFKSLRLHDLATFSHNMINIFPARQTREQNPQLLPMLADGSRYQPPDEDSKNPTNRHQNWHPCYTNRQTADIAIAAARKAFDSGEAVFSLGINDGLRTQCQCPECKRVGWPASYYQFVTRVAEAVKDRYPPHHVGVLVYGDVRRPDPQLCLPDNVIAMVTAGSRFSEWAPRASHLGYYGYFYGDGFGVPNFPLKAMTWNAAKFSTYHVESFRAETRPVWAWDAPKIYLQSRLLWDPALDPRATLSHFCNAAFGKAGPAMTQFYLHWAKLADGLVDENSPEPAPLCRLPEWRNSAAQYARVTGADYAAAQSLLTQARSLVTAGLQAQRLDMVATHAQLSHAEFDLFHTVQTIYAGNTEPRELLAPFTALEDARARRESAMDRIEAQPAWNLGAGRSSRGPGWTLDKEIASGQLTALELLRRAGALNSTAIAALPESLRSYAGPVRESNLKGIEAPTQGIYYAAPESAARFVPMSVTSRGQAWLLKTAEKPDRIEEGSMAGQYRQHWAFLSLPRAPGSGHVMFRLKIRSQARDGNLAVQLVNPWRAVEGDGLPVQTSLVFGPENSSATRELVVEPVSPSSSKAGETFGVRLQILWTPASDAAECAAELEVTRMEVARNAATSGSH